MQKPDVDRIDGLSPAIAIEQRTAGSNPRSIVATTTEIHDYLRLLFANVGRPHCPRCGKPVSRQTRRKSWTRCLRIRAHARRPDWRRWCAGGSGAHEEVVDAIRRQGFVRVRIDGEIHDIEQAPAMSAAQTAYD
jgi:excinuclease ABC subunit A